MGIELVEGMRGKYWEMWHFEFTAQGIEFKENLHAKKIRCHDPADSWIFDGIWGCYLFCEKGLIFLTKPDSIVWFGVRTMAGPGEAGA